MRLASCRPKARARVSPRTLYGGWHNVFNGIAGILNIFVMTGWWGIYTSKKKQDMLWPDMTQVVPMFANDSIFAVHSVNNPGVNLVVSVLALAANVTAVGYVAYRAKKLGVNPYKHEVFVGTKDYERAMARREDVNALTAYSVLLTG
ncbi:DUF5692 family protein [Senegalimassilia anaerobia]|uniref:DUF5692 family protein n=1 Tax=Senegalimassilia anaerobia TaxID=1473216 RepID=UPI00265E1CBD|nr:DUF5692 family protein [Senegalimassilia anaerobia]